MFPTYTSLLILLNFEGFAELSFYWLSDISESGDGGLSFFQINYGSLDWLGGYLRESQMFYHKIERKLVCLLDIGHAWGGRGAGGRKLV